MITMAGRLSSSLLTWLDLVFSYNGHLDSKIEDPTCTSSCDLPSLRPETMGG